MIRRAPDLAALAAAALGGIGVTIYLTSVHYAGIPLACTVNAVVDCATVTQSAYSVVPGTALPITVPGLAWFAASLIATVVAVRSDGRWLRAGHLAWAGAAVLVVLYLVYVEVVLLRRICEWCTVAHLLVVLTFLLALRRAQATA